MNLRKVINELSQNYVDEYYIELSKSEVLVIPVLIEIMLDTDSSNSRWAEKLLEKISADNGKAVYPFYSYIIKMLGNKNKFLAWNTWHIIANILPYDSDGELWSAVRDKFFEALNSNQVSEFSIACACAPKIIDCKDGEEDEITKAVKSAENRDFLLGNEISEPCKQAAKNKIDAFLNGNEPAENNA